MPETDELQETEEQQEVAPAVLDEAAQKLLMSLVRKVASREISPRRNELWDTTEQRFFYKNQQYGFINRDAGVYQVGQAGGGFTASGQGSTQPTFRKAYNIYLSYSKSFQAVFCQANAPTRFEAANPKDNDDIQAAREANKMQKVVDKFNPPKLAQKKVAKFLWTDSRCIAWTRYVEDGERFGYETDETTGEQRPKGQEVTDYFGVLETKIPLITGTQADWDYVNIYVDRPLSQLKHKYKDVQGLTSSALTGNDQIARLQRIGTREGMQQVTDDSISYLCVEEHHWFRPSLFSELSDDDRDKLLKLFPDGVHLENVGGTFCKATAEKMDDHIDVLFGIEDEGGGRISIGSPEIPIQKEFNDTMNYASEIIKYCVPAGWYDQEAVDTEAIEEQTSEPGNRYPIKKGARSPNEPLSNLFYNESATQFPAGLVNYMENLQGPLSQFVTGQQPSLFGGEMSDQETARGYAMARDQAMGQMALVWMPFKLFRSSILQKSVRIAAKERLARGQKNLTTLVPIAGKPGEQEEIDVAIEEIDGGNPVCSPVTDENFPESWTQRSNKFMQLVQFAQNDPVMTQVMTDPNNLKLAKDLLGLADFTIPGANDDEKQLLEISEMRKSPPVPDMAAMQQEFQQSMMATGAPPPLDPNTLPMTSSVPIGKYDNDQNEFQTCVDWINGPIGQQAKRSQDPVEQSWYQNVELHAGLHKARMDAMAAQQAQSQLAMAAIAHPAGPPKQPSGKNAEGSPEKPKQTPPEGGLPITSGPVENPSPLQ